MPQQPKKLVLDRQADRRDIFIRWEAVKGAQGYNILWGIAPDKLYSSWMVYDKTDLLMKTLTADQDYYFVWRLSMKMVYLYVRKLNM